MKNFHFTKEFQNHSSFLNGFALKLTKDRNAANDLFQETALKAFRYRNKFARNSNFKAWLTTIMKNSFINQYRKHKKRNELQDQTIRDFYFNSTDKSINNEGEMKMNLDEIVRIIDQLEDDYRIPFLMAYQGYKYDEIQKTLGNIPMGTIKNRIFKARKILRKKVNSLYPEVAA